MKLYELKKLQESKQWNDFIYLSANQLDYDSLNFVEACFRFSNMNVGYDICPRVVFFTNGRKTISDRVTELLQFDLVL